MMRRSFRWTGAMISPYRGAMGGGASLDLRPWRIPTLLAGAAIVTLVTLLALGLTALPEPLAPSIRAGASHARPQGDLMARLPTSLAPAASASIGASDRSFWPMHRGSRLLAQGGGIRSAFVTSGARLGVARGTLSLSLASAGRGRHLQAVDAVAPSVTANEILYRHGSISELYRNGPYGLEQGFTLNERQPGSGPLVLSLRLGGSLVPRQVGSQISFMTPAGATALRYGQLSVLDATGRELPAHMQIRDGSLQLRADDTGARYPLQIDPFFQQGPKLTGSGESGKAVFGLGVALSADGNTAVIGGPSDSANAGAAWVFTRTGSTWTQQGPKLTGSEESGKGRFGNGVALSADGNTAVIGGYADSGEVGAAWVFTRTGSTWGQQGPKLTGGGESGKGHFGFRVAVSEDGTTAVIGGPGDNATAGAAWVFTRTGSTWEPQGPKLAGGGEVGAGEFGVSVALSADGSTALIGGAGDGGEVGATWVFTRTGSTWEPQGPKLTASGELGLGRFGFRVALSADGSTALIGAGGDNENVGAAWVFTRSGSTWGQQGPKLTGSGEIGRAHFGYSVALSADGESALIGGLADNSEVGAAWVFKRSGSTWGQQGSKLTGSGEIGRGLFGYSVALSADASTALVGGGGDNSQVGAAWAFLDSASPPPTVTSITPTSGTSNGGTPVTIKGSGFVAGATVKIGSEATSVVVVSATEITATTAATPAGAREVVVTDTNGTSSGGPSYTYIAPTPPAVTSIKPTSGPVAGGTKVTITGKGFLPGATVTIGNAATSVVVVSATKITATTAATPAGSHEVVVSDANGTSTGGPSYSYVLVPPQVATIKPTSGPSAGGTKVTITGKNFHPGATVTIGSAATSVVVVSATKITATTAASAGGSYEVVVTDSNGTSTGGPSYTYIGPPPTVTSISPSSGSTAGGTAVTIKGTGFVAGAKVTIGSEATSVVVASATEISATTAATAAGSFKVVVVDANGTSTGGPSYTYVSPPPPPKVTSVVPTSGPTAGGTTVTIKGSGFVSGATVTIGSEATAVFVLSATEIMATTAATPAGSDEVVVTDINGTSTGGPSFTYIPPPTVTSITPSTGSTAGGTMVTIEGTGFVAGAKVEIGSEAASVVVSSATEIKATTAATAAGSYEVVVTDANGTSTGGPSYSYVVPPPTVTSVTPNMGPTAGGTGVTIKGTGFVAGATVTIGSEATKVVVVSETEITATTAATAAGAAEVVVTGTNGTSTSGPSFTYVPPPTVTSINPTLGSTAGGTQVTIVGTGFVTGATVTIGSEATSVVVLSGTEITAETAATPIGSYEVVVTDAGGTSTSGPSYVYGL